MRGEIMEEELEKKVNILNEDYMGTPISSYSKALIAFNVGDIITGTVVRVEDNLVLVDVGAKTEGYITLDHLTNKNVQSASEVVSVGDHLNVYVMEIEDKEGKLVLSKRIADEEIAWEKATKAFQTNSKVTVTVNKIVKGGMLADLYNLRAFIPASQADIQRVEDLSSFLNKEITVKIIDLDREENKIILSRRLVLQEDKEKQKEELMKVLKEGAILEATITKVTSYGAFADLGGVSGLIHISELSWRRLSHPSEVVSAGDIVKLKVLKIEPDTQKISLSLKQTTEDPWKHMEEKYPIGSIVEGRVNRIVNFGAFVKLDDNIEGLIHIQELSDKPISKVEEVVKVGDEVKVKVIDLKPKEHRLSLSLKQVVQEKERKELQELLEKTKPKETTLGDFFPGSLKEEKIW